MLYGGLPDGFWVYEYVVAYDKELYDKIYDNPKGDIHKIFSFLEALKMLNIKLDEDKASIWQHKENAICLDFSNHPVKKFAVYNGVAKKSKKGGRENCIDYGDYSCDDAFREFLKRLDIPKDTIDEIMTCYGELTYSRLLELTTKNDKVIMFYRINKYHRKYFEDKFSFSPNFKDISQINMLLD
jgi:hypothetical protein